MGASIGGTRGGSRRRGEGRRGRHTSAPSAPRLFLHCGGRNIPADLVQSKSHFPPPAPDQRRANGAQNTYLAVNRPWSSSPAIVEYPHLPERPFTVAAPLRKTL